MLIGPAELKTHLDDPEWVIFDCRHDLKDPSWGERQYQESHVPGAVFAPVDTALSGTRTGANGRHPLPSPETFAAFLRRCGVSAETFLVAYDQVGGQYSARLWWLARWIGVTRVMVLDGGWPKWLAEGLPVSHLPPAPRREGSIVARPDARQLSITADIVAGLSSCTPLVVDARAPERFRGEVEPLDPVAGHIPGARNRFYQLNLRPDLTMRPADELRPEFEALLDGVPPRDVVHQCGSGITACANLLAMEVAGLSGSRLYAGSWSEWVSDPARPVARGAG
jgi:thiosulfate/3-mercaptopyruvate sulfurtransferase